MPSMRTTMLLAAAAALTALPSCTQLGASAHVAYASFAVDGDFGYVSGAGPSSVSVAQDVESAFGLGDDQSLPYVRATLDAGVPVLSVSAFRFEDAGDGVLEANFGDSGTLVAGTPVHTDFEMFAAKAALAFEISLGPVSVAPGIAVDYIDLDVRVRDRIGIADEAAELTAPVPLAFVRGQVDLWLVTGILELGYMSVDIDDVDATVFDVEVLAMLQPLPRLDLFVGYRMIDVDADGEVDGDRFETDLQIGGFMVGGGVRF
jgi:hypothetical protein